MKALKKLILTILVILAITMVFLILWQYKNHASNPKTDIISWFEAEDKLYVVTKNIPDTNLRIDTGEEYGNYIKVYSDYEFSNTTPTPINKPDFQTDLSSIKPLKIQIGDIDGDGVKDIAVCVYKTTKFHPVLAKRPFFYRLNEGNLESVWLGSRLARPFDDYILFDVDEDDIDEIISIESTENGNKLIAIYDWKGFGFEIKTISEELQGTVTFLNNLNHKDTNVLIAISENQYQLSLQGDQIQLIKTEPIKNN